MQGGAIASARGDDAAARLLHRRDPPPAVGEARRRAAVHRRPDHPRHRRSRPADGRGAGAARRARAIRPRPAASIAARWPRSTRRASTPPTRRAGGGRSATPRCRATSTAGIRRWSSSIGESAARIGIEGVPEDADGHFLAFEDASWARLRGDNGRLRAAEGPDDMWDVGDVVLVKAIEERRRAALVLPPDPGDPGRLHGDGHPDRARARHAGRLLLPVERLQPRHPGAAPARLVVQALRLRGGARQRLQPGDDRGRRADRGGDARRGSGGRRTPTRSSTARPRSAPGSSSRAT